MSSLDGQFRCSHDILQGSRSRKRLSPIVPVGFPPNDRCVNICLEGCMTLIRVSQTFALGAIEAIAYLKRKGPRIPVVLPPCACNPRVEIVDTCLFSPQGRIERHGDDGTSHFSSRTIAVAAVLIYAGFLLNSSIDGRRTRLLHEAFPRSSELETLGMSVAFGHDKEVWRPL